MAGGAKTTTGVEGLKYTQKNQDVAFVAFNVSIANELKRRVPAHVRASTIHSLGNSNVHKAFPKTEVDERKMWKLLDDEYSFDWGIKQAAPEILRLVGLCKLTLSNTDDESLDSLCEHYGVLVNGDKRTVYDAVGRLYEASLNSLGTFIDYNDMILAPALGIVPCQQFDVLMQDEAQDANNAQREFFRRSLRPGGRLIAFGDSKQAIYGFAGAGIDSIERITKDFAATTLPLSVTYRCPLKVVVLAKTIVPQIEARPGAPDGIVEDLGERLFLSKVKPGNLVLCRLNAPLVGPAFELIRRGVKAVIRGQRHRQKLADACETHRTKNT